MINRLARLIPGGGGPPKTEEVFRPKKIKLHPTIEVILIKLKTLVTQKLKFLNIDSKAIPKLNVPSKPGGEIIPLTPIKLSLTPHWPTGEIKPIPIIPVRIKFIGVEVE